MEREVKSRPSFKDFELLFEMKALTAKKQELREPLIHLIEHAEQGARQMGHPAHAKIYELMRAQLPIDQNRNPQWPQQRGAERVVESERGRAAVRGSGDQSLDGVEEKMNEQEWDLAFPQNESEAKLRERGLAREYGQDAQDEMEENTTHIEPEKDWDLGM